jgi:hypothetical protein
VEGACGRHNLVTGGEADHTDRPKFTRQLTLRFHLLRRQFSWRS